MAPDPARREMTNGAMREARGVGREARSADGKREGKPMRTAVAAVVTILALAVGGHAAAGTVTGSWTMTVEARISGFEARTPGSRAVSPSSVRPRNAA